jgi:arylsulfatase A-like enzyme
MLPPTVNEPPTNRFAEIYEDATLTMPQEPVHPYLRAWAKQNSFEMPGVVGGTWGWAAIDALNNRRAMINVAAETTMVDDGIGRVLAKLDRLGLTDDTLVVFTSDQGSAYGQQGLWGNTSWGSPPPAYNAHMQVPLIFRHPDEISRGKRRDMMINQVDILPTVLDYLSLGDKEIAGTPGKSFAAVLHGQKIDWDDTVFFEYISTRVIQTRQWKFTKRFTGGPNELYDMAADPGETVNLVNDASMASVVADLNARLEAFFTEYADPEFDLWKGGTGKALVFYGKAENRIFADALPGWREPFIEKRPPFRDRD